MAGHENLSGLWLPGTIDPNYALAVDAERHATAIDVYNLGVIDGLLQTEEHSQRVSTGPAGEVTEAQMAERVALRTRRQDILQRDNPPRVRAVLNEFAISQGIEIDPDDQYARLRELNTLSHVDIRVLAGTDIAELEDPAIALLGNFRIIRGEAGDLLQTQTVIETRITTDKDALRTMGQGFERLYEKATPLGSVALRG